MALLWPSPWPSCTRQPVTASVWPVTLPGSVRLAVTRPKFCCSGSASTTAAPISTTSILRRAPAEVRRRCCQCCCWAHADCAEVQGGKKGKRRINNEDVWCVLYSIHKLLSIHIACICYIDFMGSIDQVINCGTRYANLKYCHILTQYYVLSSAQRCW